MSLNDARSKIIAKSYSSEVSVEDFLEKGKKANLGEVREWQGKKVQKTTQGWVLYNDKNGGHQKKHDVDTKTSSLKKLKEEVKQKHPDAIVAIEMNDFVQFSGEDARKVSEILGIALTKDSMGDELAGLQSSDFNHESLGKIIRAGFRVALVNQAPLEQEAKNSTGGNIKSLEKPLKTVNEQTNSRDSITKIVMDEGNGLVINDIYDQWSKIKNEKDQTKWREKVKGTKFGTYGLPFFEVLDKFQPKLNEVNEKNFYLEIEAALNVPKSQSKYSDQPLKKEDFIKEEKPEAPKTGIYMGKNHEGNMVKMTKKPSGDYLVDGRMIYKKSDFKSDGEYYEGRFGTFAENKPTNRNVVTGEEYLGNGKPQDAIDLRDQVKATLNPKKTEAQVTMKVLDEMKISIPDSGLLGMRMDVSGNMNIEDFTRQIKKYITNSPQRVKDAFTEDVIKQLHQDAIVSMLHSAADRDGLFIGNYVNSDRIKEALSNAKKATGGELTKSEAMQILGI